MQSDLQVRAAGLDDIEPLLALYRQLIPEDPALEVADARRILEQFSRFAGSAIFIGHVGKTLVATCALVVIPNLTRGGPPYALIENVVTDTAHRKRGYGRALLNAAVAHAWQAGCFKVMLLTGSKNPATLRFYEDLGFERTKTGCEIRRIPSRNAG